jgi:4-amino-4-deoxy-L-arabinose transferase-like glycosyltransferase
MLVATCLLAFLPGFFTIPPVDRDEARFAQATKQMLETGDLVDIRFQDETRYKKPVGIYWLQAAVVKTAESLGVPRARARIWLYRIPSLIGATGAVLLTYWAALAFVSRRAAVLAGIMMATSILLGFEARLAKTDAMLLLAVVAAMGALGRAYLGVYGRQVGRSPLLLPGIFWTALAGGVLLKGPLILMFVGLASLALIVIDRSAKWVWELKPLAGMGWLLLLVLPWFIAIVLRSGDSFFADSIGGDMLSKVGSGQESHGAPPGVYFLMFWVTFFPGAMLAGLAAPAVWRDRAEPGAKFLLAWLVPSWIVFELVPTKLPHYVLPLYPAIAILIAGVIDSHLMSRQRWLERGTMWWFIISVCVAIAALWLHIRFAQQAGLLAWPFAIAALILTLFAWWLYRVDGPEVSLLRAAAASILIAFGLHGGTFPAIPRLFPSVELSRALRNAACPDPQVATAGYHEPSLVFLTNTKTQHVDGAGAAEFLKEGGCRFVFVESRLERSFAQRADAIGLRYFAAGRVEGINLSGGRSISVAIYSAERRP